MPRQKQDRPKRTKCSANESSDATVGQESDSPGDGDKMNLDDCNSSSSSSVTSSPSSSSSTSSSHSPSSSRSSSPQPTATNPITVEESEEKNSTLEELTSKNENNTDYQQNDNLITIDNNSNHLFQKQLSPIREESYFPQEEKLESPPLLSPSPSPQPQHIHKQSSSSPPPPLLSSSSLSTPCSSSQQPLTSMSTDQISTDFMTKTKQTSPSSPLPQDDSPPSPQLSTHSTSGDDSTIPDIENKANNNYLSSAVIDVPMDESGTSSLPNTPTSSSPSPSKLTNLNRKRKVSTTDSMMTAIVSGSPTASSIPPIIKSQSTLSDSFVKPSLTPEPGTTATTTSSSIAIKLSPPPTSPQLPPPPPPPLLPPPLTSKFSNVDEKLLKELSQSSLINSLIQNSQTPSSTLPGVQKSSPSPLSLSSGGLAPTIQTTPTSSSNKQQQQQPIYVAISTNPLILVPLSYNTETGGLDLSLANSSSVVKLSNDSLLNSQLNGLIASGIDRSTLLNNSLETHRTGVENNRANLINGIDATNIINVNSLTNNIISINNSNNGIISPGDNVNNLRNLNLNNIQQLSQFSGRPQSTEGPLDLSSNPSSVDPKLHDKLSSFRSHNRHRDNDHRSSVSSYTVKNETDPMIEESESPSPLNLFNSPSTFANLVSSAHSADLPQSTASVLAAAAVAAAAAASVSSPPSSSSLAVGNSSGRVSGPLPLPGPAPNAPPSFTPEAVFKQSSYHCEHCHIGFYKKENYNIHKRFYCSARRSKAAAAAALAAASAGGVNSRSRNNTRTRSESSPDLLESDGSPNSSPEISLDSEKTDRNLTHHLSSGHHQQPLPASSSLRKSSTSRRVSISSKTNASNSSNSPGSSPPHQPLSQYYCVACGIRFTSLDNLQAHQTYYCLKRNSVNASPDKLQYIVSIPGGTGSEVSCVKCKATYCNEEAFLSHVCSAMNLGSISTGGSNGSKYNSTSTSASSSAGNASGSNDGRCSSAGGGTTSGNGGVSGSNMRRQEREDIDSGQQCFRCTICGYKGQTLQGMRIHVRMHSQCFRCTICGYKGHTLRGMRTHVRIHQDKIQGLPEETFIACIEDEALVAKSTTRSGPSSSKRRRKSLDAYSNSSNAHNQFGSSSTLSSLSNVIVSENSKPLSSQLINNLLPSTIANTSTGPAGILVSAGFTSMNNVNNNNSGTNDELISANVTNSNRNSTNNANNLNSSHSEISSENENEDEVTSNISENEMSGRDDSRQGGSGESVHNCHLCYYSSTYKGNVVRHLKLVHKDNSGGSGNGTNGPFSGINKRDSGDKVNDMDVTSGGGSGGAGGDSYGSISDDLPLDLKATRSNGSTISERRTFHNRSPIGNNNHRSAGSPIDHNSNGSSSNNNNSNNNGSSNSSAQAKKAVPKYCRSCDISFQFLTSFIAHKKYYCSSHSNDPNAIQHIPESKSPV